MTASINEAAVRNPFEPPLEDPRLATAEPLFDASGTVIRIPLDARYYRKFLYIGATALLGFACLPLLIIFGSERNPYFSLPLFLSGWYGLVFIAAGLGSSYYRYQRRPDYYGLRIDSIGVHEHVVFQFVECPWEDISSVFVADTGESRHRAVAFRFHNRRLSRLFSMGRYDTQLIQFYELSPARICEVIQSYRDAMMDLDESGHGREK